MALSNKNQAAFWEAMKEKYEKRNENLRQQETCLRQRLEQLKQLMEQQQTNDDCDCVPEKLEKPSLVQCIVQKGKELIMGSCTCGDPKLGQDFLCACHIVDPKIPLDFDTALCTNQGPPSPEGCLNQECDFYNPQLANPAEDPSIFSLKSTDIYYMEKLAELVKTEKCMQNKITELENKERCYMTALQDVNELMKKKPRNDPLRREFDRIVDCLEGENRKLKNELEDLRLELKHCFERVEGPLRRSLESQREKCADMEQKLKIFQEKMTNKEDNYLKEINEIKAKLCQACCTMVDLNNVNSRLKSDLVSLENKCLSLEDELVKQQLKEAENILKFKKVICRRSNTVDSLNRGDDSEQDLEHIARQLSETLKEVYPCVTKVPTELTETVKGIKQLTELVGEKEQRRKKRSGKTPGSVIPTTSQVESFCCCYNMEESNPESEVTTKRASTAPEAEIPDIICDKPEQPEPEKTIETNVVETASKACECGDSLSGEIEQKEPEKTTETNLVETASKACECGDSLSDKIEQKEPEKLTDANIVETASKACECDDIVSAKIEQKEPEKTIDTNIVEKASIACDCDDIVSAKIEQKEPEKTTDTNIVEKVSIACECDIELEVRSQQTDAPEEKNSKDVQDTAQSVCSCPPDEESRDIPPSKEEIPTNVEETTASICSCPDEASVATALTGELICKDVQDIAESSCPAYDQAEKKPGTAEEATQSECACGDEESTIESTVDKESKNADDEIPSNCFCDDDDQESKRTGPSEEVIAVKNLGTLCPAGVCDLQSKLKLKVDTTCDIIDVPPNDIHVVTTLAKTGSLEIKTEGPPGVIETKVNYLPCGKIEIVTKLIDRTKLNAFLEGKLLPLPEQQPDDVCNESETCGGQCNISTETMTSVEIHAVDNGTTMPINERKQSNQLSSSAPYGSPNVQTNFVLLGETRIDNQIQNEWKNTKFVNDAREEFDSSGILSNVKRMHTNKERIYSEESTDKEFKLSSRPSLTDIEKYSHENVTISGEFPNTFVHPDALETISECDEEENSARNDLKRNADDAFEDEESLDRSDACCNTSKDDLADFNEKDEELSDACCNTSKYAIGDFDIDDEETNYLYCNTSMETIGDFNMNDEDLDEPVEMRDATCESLDQDENEYVTLEKENTVLEPTRSVTAKECSCEIQIEPEKTNQSEKSLGQYSQPEECLCGNGDVCTSIHCEEQSSGTFSHLCKNLGNISVMRGNFRLRQTRSLYENKRSGIECLRVCKSAVISLGTLKIDIEMIKFIPGRPKAGDFGDKMTEINGKFNSKRSLGPLLEIENNKESERQENDKVIPLESKKGLNSPDGLQIIPEKIYQCYVNNCTKREEKYESQAISLPTTENLEERIDRLLQINPFSTPHCHRTECQCKVHNAESNSPSAIPPAEGCQGTKTSPENWSNAHQEQHRCKCTLKRQDSTTRNKLELSKHGDTLYHDENCTCVDCLCNPSKFKLFNSCLLSNLKDDKSDSCYETAKNSLADISMFKFPKPPEITVMNVMIPCDCGNTCTCDPCFDPNKEAAKSQPVEKKPANNIPKNRPSLTKQPSLQDPFNNRDTWKNVIGCYCPPSSSKKKEVCDCKDCECKPCGYTDKARKPCDCKKPKEKPKSEEPPKKKGKCNETSCVNNGRFLSGFGDTNDDNKNRASSPVTIPPHLKKNCDCEICECVFCSESETQRLPERIKEEFSVYEKPCEKKYVPLLTVEPCDRSKCECGNRKLPPIENIIGSNEPEIVEEVILKKEEPLNTEPITVETTVPPEPEKNDNSDDEVSEPSLVISDTCYCSKCSCNPCKSEVVPIKSEEEVQVIEDIPPEATDAPSEIEKPSSVIDQSQGDQSGDSTCLCLSEEIDIETKKDSICLCPSEEIVIETKKDSICLCPSEAIEIETKIPCDCVKSCPCSPCADPDVINKSPPIIGDADKAKNELRSVLEKISCTCNKAEKDLKPLLKQASNFESTVSKMKLKLNNLEQKCKDKDLIINAMTKDLRMRSESGVFANLLNDMAHPKERFVPDFNRTYVCDFLPKPRPLPGPRLQCKRGSNNRGDKKLEPILELDRYLPGGNEDIGRFRRNLDASGLEIIDIRRVTIDSVLIKWRSPCNLSGITGYQIFVNDELKYKVLSPNRTTAVLDTLELSRSLEIMLYAMSTSGRCEPPALATYKI